MALMKEEERISRQLGDVYELAMSMVNQASVLKQQGLAREGLTLAEEAHRLATTHGYTDLARKIEAILNVVRNAARSESLDATDALNSPTAVAGSSPPPRQFSTAEIREAAANALKRGLWEAAATYLEKLLQQGEPVETVAPDLITALLNAHETVSPHTVTRIETLLAQLTSAGHPALAAQLRQQHAAKLAPSKKPWWKFGR
jgi:hypothetical protein